MLRPIHSGKERSVVFPIHASDVQDGNLLWALYLTGFGIAAMAEPFLIGLIHHLQNTPPGLQLTLGQQSKLRHLGRGKQRCAGVLAGGNAGAAADTGSDIEGGLR